MKIGFDYVGVSISYFCHDGRGNYLLAKRSTQARDEHHRWDNGGGALEFGHKVEDTLKKEIKEEYCADVLEYEYLGFREAHRTHDNKNTHWISLDFRVLVNPSQVKIGEPHKFEDIGWFPIDTFPQDLHSQLPVALKQYKKKLL